VESIFSCAKAVEHLVDDCIAVARSSQLRKFASIGSQCLVSERIELPASQCLPLNASAGSYHLRSWHRPMGRGGAV